MITLRAYQEKLRKMTFDAITNGYRRIICWVMTGGGKGLSMSDFTNSALKKNKKVLVVMRRRELIFQTKNNFKKYHGIKASIIMGNSKGFDASNPVQICSIDTIRNRMKLPKYDFLKEFDLVLIDECHDTTSPTYGKFFNWMGDKIFLGFTATPFPVGNKTHVAWDTCVKPIEAHELRDLGYLVDAKMYGPKTIDTSGIRIINGDFDQKELFERVKEMSVIGDVVDTYIKYGNNKPAILFAVNKAHSAILCEAFNRAGIPAIHMDESHTSEERAIAIKKLERGEIKILGNVNIFSTGVDIPSAEIGIMARPTHSEILYVQQGGRLLRPYKECKCGAVYGGESKCHVCGSSSPAYEKPFAIILDHGNNARRHGFLFDVRNATLRPEDKERKKADERSEPKTKTCPECFALCAIKEKRCPECNAAFRTREKNALVEEDGELELLDVTKESIMRKFRQLAFQSAKFKWRSNTVFKKLYDSFGEEIFKHRFDLEIPNSFVMELKQKQLNDSAEKLLNV